MLKPKIDDFCWYIERHLPANGKKIVFATAWSATDNVFLALMKAHFPEILQGMQLVAIDTLHLFPETLGCAELVQQQIGKEALWKRPADVATLEEFHIKYGDAEQMGQGHFDFVSKVEPFQRALAECEQDILVNGRRMDHANPRMRLSIWDDKHRTLNPMALFSWEDITTCVDMYDVPVNHGHNFAFRCSAPIEVKDRTLPDLPWTKVNLGQPFWRAGDAELTQMRHNLSLAGEELRFKQKNASPITYVFKSFGDIHTTVPVELHEDERAGRLRRMKCLEEKDLCFQLF